MSSAFAIFENENGANNTTPSYEWPYLNSKIRQVYLAGDFAIEFSHTDVSPTAAATTSPHNGELPQTTSYLQPKDQVVSHAESTGMHIKRAKGTKSFETTAPAQHWAQKALSRIWAAWYAALGNPKDELSMCLPLAKLLSLLDMTSYHPDGKYYLFVPRKLPARGEGDEEKRHDVIAIEASYEEIVSFYGHKLVPRKKYNWPKRFLSEGSYHIPYAFVVSIAELNPGEARSPPKHSDVYQLLEYIFKACCYQPRHAAHKGLLVYTNGFYVADYYPEGAKFTGLFDWKNRSQVENALKDYLKGLRERSFTSQFFHVQRKSGLENRISYHRIDLPDDTAHYNLYDLHRGHGLTRNSYVAFGLLQGEVPGPELYGAAVFKHQWCDVRRSSNELDILKKIFRKGHVPGVVRPWVDLTERFNDLSTSCKSEVDADSERKSSLIVLLTLGHSLASCKSLKAFFKTIYDLVEVHRMLVEEHDVHHRDISWANILIDHVHLDGTKDDLGKRPFIDNVLSAEMDEKKIHVMLSDFDYAYMGGKDEEEAIGSADTEKKESIKMEAELTGTPAFMASDLLFFSPAAQEYPDEAKSSLGFAVAHIYDARSAQSELSLPKERVDEVKNFRDEFARRTVLEDIPTKIARVPLHDAESIYWVMVFFLLRAWPVGFDDSRDRMLARTNCIRQIVESDVGLESSSRTPLDQEHLPPQLSECFSMLHDLDIYFRRPWYRLGNESTHQFHGHNAIQRVLLSELERLGCNDVELMGEPLRIKARTSRAITTSSSFIHVGSSLVGAKRSFEADESSTSDRPSKRQRKISRTRDDNLGLYSSVLESIRQMKRWYLGVNISPRPFDIVP